MLISCPECELQVSDKAVSCPHCGYPMKPEAKRVTRKSNKRKRLPNGFGQISEIKGRNLRNPFRAMVTIGKTPTGRPICKPLKPNAFFPTYNDAYQALMDYNKNPYDLEKDITVKELYEKWSEVHFKTLKSEVSVRGFKATWKYCESLYNVPVREIRVRHIKSCMENGTMIDKSGNEVPLNANLKNRIKTLFNLMFDYAVEYEMTDKNYARGFKLSSDVAEEASTVEKGHIAFTDEEMQLLWDNIDKYKFADILIIQCYSGWRPQEILKIETSDVDIENWTFKGGMKTKAGIDRVVPIHPKIRHLVKANYDEAIEYGSQYLIKLIKAKKARPLSYIRYWEYFTRMRDGLNLNPEHRPHDGRKHFVTMAKKYKVDEYAIKYLVGHAISDITEKIYTERDPQWLVKEIEKIQ